MGRARRMLSIVASGSGPTAVYYSYIAIYIYIYITLVGCLSMAGGTGEIAGDTPPLLEKTVWHASLCL